MAQPHLMRYMARHFVFLVLTILYRTSRGVDMLIRRESAAVSLSADHSTEADEVLGGIRKRGHEACTQLTNRGSYFTAAIAVGSQNQTFDVVADTGSNAVIVADCLCNGYSCPEDQNCFDENKSKSCSVNKSSDGKVPVVQLTFGSGQILSMVASDVVAVGSRRVMMSDALLLMLERALTIKGRFDGILGLGIALSDGGSAGKSKITHKDTGEEYHITGFMERDGIGRFSMCFVDNGNGTLRIDTSASQKPLHSVGHNHWGLDFRGITIGEDSQEGQAIFCKDVPEGQQTPCGAVPDSGTTLITGPEEQLTALYGSLCDAWDRCKKAFEDSKFPGKSKDEAFLLLLVTCQDWMDTDSATPLAELPTLKFHLRDTSDTKQALIFKGNDYIELGVEKDSFLASRTTHTRETVSAFIERHRKLLGVSEFVCIPAMGTMDPPMVTQENGPIWILGTPLFYAYQVDYDLTDSPPSMGFQKATCEPCVGELLEAQLEHTGVATLGHHGGRSTAKHPRHIRGPVRWPTHPFVGPL